MSALIWSILLPVAAAYASVCLLLAARAIVEVWSWDRGQERSSARRRAELDRIWSREKGGIR